jgi:hypothetical protein
MIAHQILLKKVDISILLKKPVDMEKALVLVASKDLAKPKLPPLNIVSKTAAAIEATNTNAVFLFLIIEVC